MPVSSVVKKGPWSSWVAPLAWMLIKALTAGTRGHHVIVAYKGMARTHSGAIRV